MTNTERLLQNHKFMSYPETCAFLALAGWENTGHQTFMWTKPDEDADFCTLGAYLIQVGIDSAGERVSENFFNNLYRQLQYEGWDPGGSI